MFKQIEGQVNAEKTEQIEKKRMEFANKLWNFTCCFENVFNETSFKEV